MNPEFHKGQLIPTTHGCKYIVLDVTEKRVTVGIYGNVIRKYTFQWDGTGYKRQGQYLTPKEN